MLFEHIVTSIKIKFAKDCVFIKMLSNPSEAQGNRFGRDCRIKRSEDFSFFVYGTYILSDLLAHVSCHKCSQEWIFIQRCRGLPL